jgi:hypothetical protein
MAVPVQCEQCQAKYLIEDRFAGKRAKCKRCGNVMSIPLPAGPGGMPGLSSDDTGGTGEIGMDVSPFGGPGPSHGGGVTSQPPRGWRPQDVVVERDDDITDIPLAYGGGSSRAFTRPTGRTYDALVPLLLILYAAVIVYFGWSAQTRAETKYPAEVVAAAGGWIKAYIWGQAGFMLIGLFAIAGPLILAGVAGGLKIRNIGLPGSAYLKACALAAIPGALLAYAMIAKNSESSDDAVFAGALLLAAVGGYFAVRFIIGLDWINAGICFGFAAILGVIGTLIAARVAASAADAMFTPSLQREIERAHTTASKSRMAKSTGTDTATTPPPAPAPAAPTPAVPEPAAPVPLPADPATPPRVTAVTPSPNVPVAGAPDDPSGDGLGDPTTPTVKRGVPVPLRPGSPRAGVPGTPERDSIFETGVDDMKSRVIAAGGAILKGVDGLPLQRDLVGVIHAPGPSTAFALQRRSVAAGAAPREDMLDIYNGTPAARVATAAFALENAAAQPSYTLSADGTRLARIAEFPKLSVRVTSVPDNKEVGTVELDSKFGRPTLLGFLTNDRVLVRWESGNQYGLEVEDLRSHRHAKRIDLPDYDPSPSCSAVSPDGRFFAYVPRTIGKTVINFTSLFEGGRPRQLPVNAIDPKLNLRPAGLAFSSDGGKLSALYVQGVSAVIASWNVRGGPALPDLTITAAVQTLEALPGAAAAAARGAFGRGTPNSLTYVGNSAMLIGGSLLISAVDGNPIVELGIDKPFVQFDAGDSSVFVGFRDVATPLGLQTVTFDPATLPTPPGRAAPGAPAPRPAPAAGTPIPRPSSAQ